MNVKKWNTKIESIVGNYYHVSSILETFCRLIQLKFNREIGRYEFLGPIGYEQTC